MKLSENWLRTWVKVDSPRDKLVAQLTMAGLEVDSVQPVAAEFTGVVVGKVITCEKHPEADKLSVCKVTTGGEEALDIVCGAKNVRAGLKVAVATVGAVLPNNFKIKKAKLRGAPSHGMLCSTSELGLSEQAEGIIELPEDAPIGEDIRHYLDLDDHIIEVDLTPNRGDCLSVAGIAREVAVLNDTQIRIEAVEEIKSQTDATIPVTLSAPDACPHYVGRVIKGVNVNVATPLWMRERLRRSGIRSIDPIVDVTNYVMLELGQPMHAFDLAMLNGGINVRMAEAGETLTLLDDSKITLSEQNLLITDEKKILALAGIMGGKDSGVNAETKDIFLESAFFAPQAIAGKARSFGLHTDSSHRFERGVDPALQLAAIERATTLLLDIVGGQPGPIIDVRDEAHIPTPVNISLPITKIKRVLGIELATPVIIGIFERLGMDVKDEGETLHVRVPTSRFDITIAEDLIEEVARIYGYDNIPAHLPHAELTMQPLPEERVTLNAMKTVLVEQGFREAITYSFVDPTWQAAINPDMEAVNLVNALSPELSQMRTSLWPGLMHAVQFNQNRQQPTVRLFESGLRFFVQNGELKQQNVLAGVITGSRAPKQWGIPSQPVDFFDSKATIEQLLELTADVSAFSFEVANHPALHPGQSARILRVDTETGWVGALHPKLEKTLAVQGPVFLFELYLDVLEKAVLPRFESVSKFPAIRRDLALVADETVPAAKILATIAAIGGELVKDISIFDIYQGDGVAEGKKSLALGITLQHQERTLVDDEVARLVDDVVQGLQQQLDITLRE